MASTTRTRSADYWANEIAKAESLQERYVEMMETAKRLELGDEEDRFAELVEEYGREVDALIDGAIRAGAL